MSGCIWSAKPRETCRRRMPFNRRERRLTRLALIVAGSALALVTAHAPVVAQFFGEADVELVKTDSPDPVVVGETLRYTLLVNNLGPDPARNVALSDTLPAGVTFVSVVASQGSCGYSTGTVTCSLADLAQPPPGGVATATVTIDVTPTQAGTTVQNTATVSTGTEDFDQSNNTATATTEVIQAKLTIAKDADPDNEQDFDFTTVNLPSDAGGFELDDDTDPTLSNRRVFDISSLDTKTVTEGPLPPGWDIADIACTGDTAGVTIGQAGVAASFDGDYDGGDNGVRVPMDVGDNVTCTFTNVMRIADVSLAMAGPSSAGTRSDMTYTLTIENTGPHVATNVVLTDALPYGAQYLGFMSSQGSCTPPGRDVVLVTCQLGVVASGATATTSVTVKVRAQPGKGFLNNLVTVDGDENDPDTRDNSASLSTAVTR